MFNYDNIGGKIKDWAKWIFISEAIFAVIYGFVQLYEGVDSVQKGLLFIFFGPIVAWVSSWILYGYGELIENTAIIAEEYSRKNEKHEKVLAIRDAKKEKRKAEKEAQRRETAKSSLNDSSVSDDEFIDFSCPNCKGELSFTKELLQSGEAVCPLCDTHITL